MSKARNIIRFLSFSSLVTLLVFLAPYAEKILLPESWTKTVHDSDIDVGALFYTEESHTRQAEEVIKSSLDKEIEE